MNKLNSLRSIRKQTIVTQADISHLLGRVDSTLIHQIEEGTHPINLTIILTYIILFGKSIIDLFPKDVETIKYQLKERLPALLISMDELGETSDVKARINFFENLFDQESLQKHFDFYEPLTVHESSLSPCVHSILAAKIDRIDKAYEMYLRTSRLDLDDYNHEVHEGLHITSMAGTWLSIVQGFGGMRNFNDQLSFDPKIPKNWKSYSFKIKYSVDIPQ